jgi:molybdopterin-containing oxidoreductase family iron-sulfur binding subunit
MIARFLSGFNDAKHVQYSSLSQSAILDAHKITHGTRVLPRYYFDRAETIVSFDADFLGTWISPVEFTAGYRSGRTLIGTPPKFSHHTQFESRLSLTGSNADERIAVSPAELERCAGRLAALLAGKAGRATPISAELAGALEDKIVALADRLWESQGKSLVVCGSNDLQLQLLTNAINHQLGNYNRTLNVFQPSHQVKEHDAALQALIDEIHSGTVSALFIAGGNPVYDLPGGEKLAISMKNIPLVVSFAERLDETATVASVVCPQPHFLEAWIDAEPVAGVLSITQPTIQPLMNTQALIESLSGWIGQPRKAYDLIRAEWEKTIFKRRSAESSFEKFWSKTLQDGFAIAAPSKEAKASFDNSAFESSLTNDSGIGDEGVTVLLLHASLTMLDGRHAHNPWLHELPDPVTKIVWDNCAAISPTTAQRLGLSEGDIVQIAANDTGTIELPVHIQPGQHNAVVAVSLGYGRKGTDRFTNIGPEWLQSRSTVEPGGVVGRNAVPFSGFRKGLLSHSGRVVVLSPTGRSQSLVATQEYNSLHDPDLFGKPSEERRPIVQETTLIAYTANPTAGSFHKPELDSMWPEDHTYTGHHWGMVVDLTACTGCSACVVGCQAENNIPVVGKDEVRRNRELTWIRLDRYYDEAGGEFSVSHQPMMCQHCGNAPCETVCPVLATVHNSEGLNQQVYNRCVGTRYCANNCPYKIRRFNWFQYPRGDEMQKMVLNPDVTVRDRGVMEKCSFCTQRIQLAKIDAKRDGRKLKDGDIQPACAQSCPAQAIAFGDMNDPQSEVSKRMKDKRYYRVLEELGVRPSVGYMTLIRNREARKEEPHHG